MYFPYRDLYTGLIKNWLSLFEKKIQSCIFEELSSSCFSKHSLHFTERLGNYIEDYLEITKSNISSTTRWEQKPTLLIKITPGKIAKKKMCVNLFYLTVHFFAVDNNNLDILFLPLLTKRNWTSVVLKSYTYCLIPISQLWY